jgi:hypothetical protein
MPTYQPVTDPALLQQLNSTEVTDPSVISQLNGPQTIWNKLGQTWPAKMAKEIYSGVTLPGDVYSGKTQVDPSNPEFINRVTSLGSVAPVGTLPSVISAAPSVQTLVQTGGKQIDEAVKSGLMFPQSKVQESIDAIRQNLPKKRNAEDTHAAIDDLEAKANSGDPFTFDDFKKAREDLQDVQRNSAKSTSRTAASDLSASTMAKHELDNLVKGTPEGDKFVEGNLNVSGGKTAETLDKKLYRSELRSSAANSGKNVGNTIRSNIASLLLSKDARTLTPETRQQAESIVYGSGPENFMRHWGNVLGGGGGLGQAAAMAGSGALGYLASGGSPTMAGIAATSLPIVGALLKHGANETAISHLEALSNALRGGTPLGQTATRGNYLDGAMPSTAAAKAALIRALMAHEIQQPTQP